MVEQWTENPCVPGSIPGGTTKNKPLISVDVQGFFILNEKTLNCLIDNQGFKVLEWYLQGSNQGHMDFQSIALPSELRYRS